MQDTDPDATPGVRDSTGEKLERTLGLPAALSIGVGTMVGAGIFVFPGLVADLAGPAGVLSFLLAGSVALLVALHTSELATAMPVSGGSYTFIERVFGRFVGSIIGLAQWAGLVFASAFYLTSFGEYSGALLDRFGAGHGAWLRHSAPASALLLTAVNLAGSGQAGKLQKHVVIVLTLALAAIFVYGLGAAAAGKVTLHYSDSFAPNGAIPIFTTAAMIFTAFIGFVQIAAVGGEIREPRRNLPRGLIGSVVLVLALYLLVYGMSIGVLQVEDLAASRETAVVEVARTLLGPLGAGTALLAGLLATLSSANASILSASRTLFALARDSEIPRPFARVSTRRSVPWIAILSVGIPAAALSYLGLELLAEVAALLHLFIYALICLAAARLRSDCPDWYKPSFHSPGAAWLPVVTAMICLGLIAFMQPLAMLAGLGTLTAAAGTYVIYQRLVRWTADA